MDEPHVFSQIFFFSDRSFIGQRNISPTVQIIESLSIIEKRDQSMSHRQPLLSRRSTKFIIESREKKASAGQIVRSDAYFSFQMRGINCVDFDLDKQMLYLIRQQILDPEEDCLVYRFDLRKYL